METPPHDGGRLFPETATFSGFWRRFLAFLIDVIPITGITFIAYYSFGPFAEVLQRYVADPSDLDSRVEFLLHRNLIRDTSAVAYVLYSAALESTKLQGTLGKRLMRITVVGEKGERIGAGRALGRNVAKMLSFVPAFLGCLAMLWSKRRQAWHDRIAVTFVVRRGTRVSAMGRAVD